MNYEVIKITAGVVSILALYSILYKENKFYRFFEHVFLGLAAGYTIVAQWKDTLYPQWWVKMLGSPAVFKDGVETSPVVPGYWIFAALLPIGMLAYLVFNRKHNWMSKIPIGVILGLWSGQQIQNWWNTWGPQILSSMQPVIPTTFSSLTVPSRVEVVGGQIVPRQNAAEIGVEIANNLYLSQALTNLIFVVTFVSAFSYFIFSFELKGKLLTGVNKLGRWMLMIGFGAIFGSTVMARFALVIDRMSYIVNEWVQVLTQR
jgi:hypothetical protein